MSDNECCDGVWDEEHQAYDHTSTCTRFESSYLEGYCACGSKRLEDGVKALLSNNIKHTSETCDPYVISEASSGLFPNPQLGPPRFG